jgi:hypothetical protein
MRNPVKLLGLGISYLGLGAVFAMAVIGTISIDLVILAYIAKESRSNSSNIFLSLMLWNFMFRHDSAYVSFGVSLLVSPFLSAISVGLAVALGVPEIAVLLIAGWAGAFTIILAGAVIYGLGDAIQATWDAICTSLQSSRNASNSTTYQPEPRRVSSPGYNNEAPPPYEPPTFQEATPDYKAANEDIWADQTHYKSPLQASAPVAENNAPAEQNSCTIS